MSKKIIFQTCCFLLLLVAHFYFSYDFNGAWWHSAAGSVLIFFFAYLIWNNDFISISGLKLTPRILLVTLLATALVTGVSFLSMKHIADQHSISIHLSSLKNYLHNAFYIMNEELILGAMLLHLLIKRFKIKPLVASLSLALLFSLAHLVLYKWYFRDKGYLELGTLLTLFMTIFVKNNLILQYKHIAYAWALHFGWMVVMYASEHTHTASNLPLTDLEKFNLYLGSPGIVVTSFLLAAASLFFSPKELLLKRDV